MGKSRSADWSREAGGSREVIRSRGMGGSRAADCSCTGSGRSRAASQYWALRKYGTEGGSWASARFRAMGKYQAASQSRDFGRCRMPGRFRAANGSRVEGGDSHLNSMTPNLQCMLVFVICLKM